MDQSVIPGSWESRNFRAILEDSIGDLRPNIEVNRVWQSIDEYQKSQRVKSYKGKWMWYYSCAEYHLQEGVK